MYTSLYMIVPSPVGTKIPPNNGEVIKMRYILAVFIITIMIGLFFVSLDNLIDYGVSGLALAGISSFVLFKIFKFLLHGYKPGGAKETRSTGSSYDPLEYVIFCDIAGDAETNDRDN